VDIVHEVEEAVGSHHHSHNPDPGVDEAKDVVVHMAAGLHVGCTGHPHNTVLLAGEDILAGILLEAAGCSTDRT
jgi:hypothetical protein